MKFITIKMVDPIVATDEANDVYIRPSIIIQIEPYSGPFGIQAFGPDGKTTTTGQYKQVIGGSVIMLAGQGGRVCYDNPEAILEKIEESEQAEKFEA